MPKRTNPFQKLITSIMAAFYEFDFLVEESILETNPRTGTIREIDIRITELSNPTNKIMIECRNHKRRQDVQWIDQLAGKSESLGYSKVIAVSSKGFTSTAITEAQDRGIETLQLLQAEERDWKQWFFAIREMGIETTILELVDVSFGIDEDWNGNVDLTKKLSEIYLVDKRNTERKPIKEWIDGLQKDPVQLAFMDNASKHGKINPIIYTHRCSNDMGFELSGESGFIPLVELKVSFNYKVEKNNVPLDHVILDDDRYLVGDTIINNVPTKLVIHECKNREITILFEQNKVL